jgi:hypothetical protein
MSGPKEPNLPSKGQFLVYQTEDGQVKIDVRLEGETAWLIQAHMAELFQTTVPNVSMHLRNVYAEGELQAAATVKEYLIVRQEGNRWVSRAVERASEFAVSPVVRRFINAVHTGGLRKVTVLTDADCDDLKEGYGFCCTHCHTDPPGVNRPTPTPDKIKDEIDRLRNWFDSVRTRQEQKK